MLFASHPGGMTEISRWLSKATPPDTDSDIVLCIPEGCQRSRLADHQPGGRGSCRAARARPRPLAFAAPQEPRPRAMNTMEVIVRRVSDVPVARSSRRSATEIRPARHRPDLGKTRVSRSSRRRNSSRGATSPTRSISEKSTTVRPSLHFDPVHSTGLALPKSGYPSQWALWHSVPSSAGGRISPKLRFARMPDRSERADVSPPYSSDVLRPNDGFATDQAPPNTLD